MSDSEATAAEGPEVAPNSQDASSASTPDGSTPTTPDIATDVAPTRKARRRPDTKTSAEAEQTSKVEQQPPKVLMRKSFSHTQFILDTSRNYGKHIIYLQFESLFF